MRSVLEDVLEAVESKSPVGNTGDFSENGGVRAPVRRLQAGVDQIEIRFLLDARAVPILSRWETKAASKGRVRLGRSGDFGKWEPMLGRPVLYRSDDRTMWIDIHPYTDARLLPLDLVYGYVWSVLEKFAVLGLVPEPGSSVSVTRVDVTADCVFPEAVDGKAWMLALASARAPHGRRMRPFNHDHETIYLETRGGKKLGLVYDKGTERGYAKLGPNKWIRLEARQFWNGADAPGLEEMTPELLKGVWSDRFLTLGGGRTVKPGGVVVTVGEMLRSGEISVRDGEKLIAYLELERAGLARDAYGEKALAERRRLAREHGLRVDEEGREIDVDLRAILSEYAEQL